MLDNSREKFIADLRKQNDEYAAKLNEELNREFIELMIARNKNDLKKGVNNAR